MTQDTKRHQLWLSSMDTHTRRCGAERLRISQGLPLPGLKSDKGCLPFDQLNQVIPSFLLPPVVGPGAFWEFHVVILGLNPQKKRMTIGSPVGPEMLYSPGFAIGKESASVQLCLETQT